MLLSESIQAAGWRWTRKGGWLLSTRSPTKTIFSDGQDDPDGARGRTGMMFEADGILAPVQDISCVNEISGGAQRTEPSPGIDSQLAPVSSPWALKVVGGCGRRGRSSRGR